MFSYTFSSVFLAFLTFYFETNGQLETEKMIPVPGVNSKSEDCESIGTPTGEFEKISPSSKYLIFNGKSGEDGYSGDESDDICEQVDKLEQAEVTNAYDLQSIEKYVFTSVWIGLNHRNSSGIFTESDGDPIQFQSFVGMEPNNLEMSERCVMLSPIKGGFLAMADAGCDSVKAGVLCQYKKGSSCFLQSAEETTSSSAKEKAEVVTLAAGSRFFISTVQKPWDGAFEACKSSGLQLITLDDDDINQDLAEQVKKRLAEKHYIPATQFWTAGTLQENQATTRLTWLIGEETLLPATDLVPHQWAKATPDATEPYDQSGSGLEACLDISFENSELASAGSYTPLWRAGNCLLPKYFLCEKIPNGVPEDAIKKIVNEVIDEEGDANEDGLEGRSGGAREIQSCGDLHVDPVNFEIDITKPQTEEDIIKFIIFNIENDLKSGSAPYNISDEIKWKETVVNLLVKIVQKAVDPLYIDHGMLNVVKVVILMYLNAANTNASENEDLWESIYIKHLEKCLNSTSKLPLTGNGIQIRFYGEEGGDIEEIEVPEEYADKIENLDSSIDILWFMFSFVIGNCYHLPKNNSIAFASDFHVLFIADFIHDLREKWTINVETAESEDSRGLDFSLALGDVDFMQSFRNLRYLVTAAYMKSEIKDLQLVRPLDMSLIESDLPKAKENAKTGNTLHSR